MGKPTWQDIDIPTFLDKVNVANLVGFSPNAVFFVDASNGNASSSNDGLTRGAPLATLSQGLGKCTSSKGDVVVLMPGHTETLSATTQGIDVSKSGVTILGFGNGRNRPALTCGSADIVGMLLSGNNNRVKNVRFIGSTAQTSTGSVHLSITGTDNTVEDCVFEHGGAGPLGCILMTACHRTKLQRLTFIGTSAGPDFCIKTTGTDTPSRDCIITDIEAHYATSAGLDSAVIVCHNTTGIPGWDIARVRGMMLGVGVLDINGSGIATQCDSLASEIYGIFGSATSTAAAFDLGSTAIVNSFWTDAIANPAMWTGVALRVAGTTGTVGAFPTAAGPS